MDKRGKRISINKISAKVGALFVKELLNKQYKLNYYQRIKAQSEAFNKWKLQYRKSVELENIRKGKQASSTKSNKSKIRK